MNKLPDKWTIKRNDENWSTVTSYLNSLGGSYCMYNPIFPWVTNWEGYNQSTSSKHSDYEEITFEDFKRLVLKEKTELKLLLW